MTRTRRGCDEILGIRIIRGTKPKYCRHQAVNRARGLTTRNFQNDILASSLVELLNEENNVLRGKRLQVWDVHGTLNDEARVLCLGGALHVMQADISKAHSAN